MQSLETYFLDPTVQFAFSVFWIVRSNTSGKLLWHRFEKAGNGSIVFLHHLLDPRARDKRPLLFGKREDCLLYTSDAADE